MRAAAPILMATVLVATPLEAGSLAQADPELGTDRAAGVDTGSWAAGEWIAIRRSDVSRLEIPHSNWGWVAATSTLERLQWQYERVRFRYLGHELELKDWSVSPDSLYGVVSATGGGMKSKPPRRVGMGISLMAAVGFHSGHQGSDFHREDLEDLCDLPGYICIGEFPADESLLPSFALAYALSGRWEIRGLVSGWADGPWDLWIKESQAMRYGVAVSRRFAASYLRIGLGPAVLSSRLESEVSTETNTRVGFVIDSGFSWPRHSHVFLDLSFQYWHGGAVPLPNPEDSEASYLLNRTWFGLGLGFRI